MSSPENLTVEINLPLSQAINHLSKRMELSSTDIVEDAVQAYLRGDITDHMKEVKTVDEFLKLYDVYVKEKWGKAGKP